MGKNWTIAYWDDWAGLYNPDGELVYENHDVDTSELIHFMNLPLEEFWAKEIEDATGFPTHLAGLEHE